MLFVVQRRCNLVLGFTVRSPGRDLQEISVCSEYSNTLCVLGTQNTAILLEYIQPFFLPGRHLAHLNATKQLYQDGMKKLLHYCAFPKVNNNNNDKKKTFWKIRENSDN